MGANGVTFSGSHGDVAGDEDGTKPKKDKKEKKEKKEKKDKKKEKVKSESAIPQEVRTARLYVVSANCERLDSSRLLTPHVHRHHYHPTLQEVINRRNRRRRRRRKLR